MRDKLIRPQMVTVRALKPKAGDVFGDAPVVMPDNRENAFSMKMGVSWSTRRPFEPGRPGKDESKVVIILIRKRDIPPTAPTGWEPSSDDLFELASGEKLFVSSIEFAFPRRISTRTPNGGWDGFRVIANSTQPTTSAAAKY